MPRKPILPTGLKGKISTEELLRKMLNTKPASKEGEKQKTKLNKDKI